jgi:hypothetical protein
MRRQNMAKKILIVSAVLGFALAGLAFAGGEKEPTAPGQTAPITSGQKLTLTGPLSFQNLIHPTLKSSDKVYELMVPRYLVEQAGLKEGAKVTVEGYQVAEDDGNIDVFVTKATIDGKDYDLSQFRGRGMRGDSPRGDSPRRDGRWGGGMMGGGPRGGGPRGGSWM